MHLQGGYSGNRKRTKACWLWQTCGRIFSNKLSVKGVALGVTLSPTVQIGYLPGKRCLTASNDASVGQTRSPQSCTGRLPAGKALTIIRRKILCLLYCAGGWFGCLEGNCWAHSQANRASKQSRYCWRILPLWNPKISISKNTEWAHGCLKVCFK